MKYTQLAVISALFAKCHAIQIGAMAKEEIPQYAQGRTSTLDLIYNCRTLLDEMMAPKGREVVCTQQCPEVYDCPCEQRLDFNPYITSCQ